MLARDKTQIAYVCIALVLLYTIFLLFDNSKLLHSPSADWPLFGNSKTELEKVEGYSPGDAKETSGSYTEGSSRLAYSSNPSPTVEPSHDAPSPTSPPTIPTLAIATFLTGQSTDDTYFNLTRLLGYQLLHVPETRIQNPNLTFVVLCGKKLPEAKRETLYKDGATIIELEDVALPPWIHAPTPRWTEQFTKLRIFEQTQYSRILYIDADYMIMHRMDGIFQEAIVSELTPTLFTRKQEIKEDEGPLPKEWLFAGRSENGEQGGFDHFVPPIQTDSANGGFFMIAPQQEMYDHLMRVMQLQGRFDTYFMEQALLNYVFRRHGPMPWRELDWKWSSNFVNQRDVDGGVHALHGKFWGEGPEVVQRKWRDLMQQMDERDAGRG
jgi:inositol 3-alpha-galactosyltransferase